VLAAEIVEFARLKATDQFMTMAALQVAYLVFAPDSQQPKSADPA